MCRVRPAIVGNGRAEEAADAAVEVKDEFTLSVDDGRAPQPRKYEFDTCFVPAASQEEVYAETESLLQSAFDGYNVCIFCYGQTGSGKTHTITGTAAAPGIIPRAMEGIFAQAAPGRPLEKIRGERRERVRAIPRDQILEAALHDFLLCEGDRHMGNIYLDDDNNIMLIDNDKALGNQAGMTRVIARQANLKCQPSSLFLPMTMESYRLNNGDLGYLDYRCHVGEDKGLWVPPKTRECLEMMAGMTAQQVKEKYGILYLEWAEDLRTRAKDLLELGFWQALLNAVEHSRQEHDRLEARRPPADDERYRGWRGAFWRPLLATHCDP
mmetsp:Transcript_25513/g.66217  ORF Transcript_25513/g.66217 Transcript_25513/m.66217 type:complete len:325 (-) Transcript_25513:69-1043(-)